MIEQFAKGATRFCIRREIITAEESPVYAYGFELLLSTFINIVLVLIIGVVFGIILEAVIFMFGFVLLRSVAGGVHAKSHRACITAFLIIFITFSVSMVYLPVIWASLYCLCCGVVSSLIIYTIAPVPAVNKPISEKKSKKYRNYSLRVACTNMGIALFIFIFPDIMHQGFVFYFSGMIAASLSLIVAIQIFRKEEVKNVNKSNQ